MRIRATAAVVSVLSLAGLCLLGAYYFLRFPIVAGDSDLWYHLNAGRYIFEHGRIPSESFFSFIAPPKPWVDYYWLFQALVYQLYQWWGYQGLVIFRACLFTAAIALIGLFLLRRWPSQASRLGALGLCVLYFILFIPRGVLVRPHLITYIFIPLFLLILEHAPKRAWVLVPLAVLWVNVHGLEYPVMYLIVGAYALEDLVHRLRGAEAPRPGRLACAALVLGTVFLTPHGARLPQLAFTPLTYAASVIQEYQPVKPADFTWTEFVPTFQTAFNLIMYLAGFAGFVALLRRQLRLSHLVLLAGGIVIATKGSRFMYEGALLALPTLRATAPLWAVLPARASSPPAPTAAALAALLVVTPVLACRSMLLPRPRYPFSSSRLPQGVAAFLNQVGVGGRVLNNPNTGGYLEWMLSPRYTIFMDMQVPFLFTDTELQLSEATGLDLVALRRMLAAYDPSFLSVSLQNKEFPRLIGAVNDFLLVFFDDAEALYINQRRHPELALRYRLPGVDPFAMIQGNLEDVLDEQPPVLAYAAQLLAMHPESRLMRSLTAGAYLRDGTFDLALEHAQAIVRNVPDDPIGYLLSGNALRGLGRTREAHAAYQRALTLSRGLGRRPVYRGLFETFRAAGQHRQAYEAASKLCGALSPGCAVEDLFDIGLAARNAGRLWESETVFAYLTGYRLSPEETLWRRRVHEARTRLPEPRAIPHKN